MLLVAIVGGGILTGCALFGFVEYDPDEGYDEEVVEENVDFVVSCSETETTIKLHNIGLYGDLGKLVYVKPYEYIAGETDVGVSENKNVAPNVIANYECGTEAVFKIKRFVVEDYTDPDYYDTAYCKFFVLSNNNKIIAGPIYTTSVPSEFDHDEVIVAKGIKGIFTDWGQESYISDLGAEHTETNFLATAMIVPLERVETDENGTVTEIVPIEYEEHLDGDGKGYVIAKNAPAPYNGRQYVEAYWHNGRKYYFRTAAWAGYVTNLDFYDNLVSQFTRLGVKASLIVLVQLEKNQYILPYFLTYATARAKANYGAVNTSNEYGAEYWSAFMEFVSRRYSQEETWQDAEYGTVETWIMGNEIDQSDSWNSLIDPNKQEMLEVGPYSVEYERMLRITNTSFKKSYALNTPLISFTQWWNSAGGRYDYHPKDLFDFISAKTKREGNYNWGLVAHPHGYCKSHVGYWTNDINSGVTGALNTPRISWTNMEVLQLYLEQPTKLCFGEVRSVYITEGGVSSGPYAAAYTSQEEQAAGVALAYYKCTQLSCIKALNYYRLQDHSYEITLGDYYFGLLDTSGRKKLAYEVYKYIDTERTWEISGPYLQYITWIKIENGQRNYYGTQYNNVSSYQDVMPLVVSLFDWGSHWDESKIIIKKS